jgi:D-amino-acid dehydrogenase
MKVLVLGSGVIGVTSAWYLAEAGHEVTVLDRQPGAGLETSFANAGEISPGYSSPWAAPGVPQKAMGWMLDPNGPLRFYPQLSIAQWRWMLAMLMNCNTTRYEINKARMQRLATYARECFIALRRDTGISYDDRQQGTLQFFRTQKAMRNVPLDCKVLSELGIPHQVLDAKGCLAYEPGLAAIQHKIAGALLLPNDETGDCFTFTQKLAEMAAQRGVRFQYNTKIEAIVADGDRVRSIATPEGGLTADAYVVALGSYSPLLTRPIGIDLPVYPVKGYSLTVPITDPKRAPESTIMDDAYKVALTRLGNRIRVAGTAEVGGYDAEMRESRLNTIRFVLQDVFPGGGDMSQITYWTGMRPMTPDGTPVVGPTHYKNLYLNTGHGTLGWTMSCGSGRVIADVISGKKTDISMEGLTVARYGA